MLVSMKYAVYIALPLGDDAERIVDAASEAALPGFPFQLREHSDPSESSDGELFFRVGGVEQPEEALERALQVYVAAREAAGLRPDDTVEPSLVPAPRST
jgi:hypothetical protein